MKQLQYPFDAEEILKKKKAIRRELLSAPKEGFIDKKIAILGGFTTNNIRLILELFLLNQGIRPQFYESEYAQYYQDALFPGAGLMEFAPDVIYVCTCNRNITSYPKLTDSEEQVKILLDNEEQKMISVWESLAKKFHCPVIQNNFEMPYTRLLGNRDAWDIHGATHFLSVLNERIYAYAQTHQNFYVCDLNYIAADYGLKKFSDPFYYHMYKYAVAVPAIPYLAHNVANMIKSIFGKNKKGLVLDLDNTLWGGVIGDDGVDNIVLGPEESEGQAYIEFQRFIKKYKQLGIVLNVASKNDEENALAGLRHPDSELGPDDFVCIKANWEPKDHNLASIASELNLLPESLVFVDDNPAERHIVTEQLPGVAAPEIGEIYQYPGVIDRSGFFEVTSLSADDLKRNEMYQENAKRAKLEATFDNYEDYLRSLDMTAIIKPFETVYMARIAQLTNKSNQFNLTTRRFAQSDIEAMAADHRFITLYGKLEDRFGDNGVVSVVIGRMEDMVCHIDLWLMSCRVLKRDMEYAMMDALAQNCIDRGIREIKGYYYPTAKNHMVANFYNLQGFTRESVDAVGNTIWKLNLTDGYEKKNHVIQINWDAGRGDECWKSDRKED